SWQVRHDYSFADLGLPGLKLMNRYTHGHNIEHAGGRGKEWERNTDLVYVIQSGALKNLSLHWRNATYRSNYATDMDENRLIIGYTCDRYHAHGRRARPAAAKGAPHPYFHHPRRQPSATGRRRHVRQPPQGPAVPLGR